MNIMNIDLTSLKALVGESNQAMVYGYHDTSYGSLEALLILNPASQIYKTFDSSTIREIDAKTLEGRIIETVPTKKISEKNLTPTLNKNIKYACKASIVTLALENYKRKVEKIPIIPLIFVVNLNNSLSYYNPKEISESDRQSARVTPSEIRMCYKLYSEFKDSPIKELADAVKEMFLFVNIQVNARNNVNFEKVNPVWEHAAWTQEWTKRQQGKDASKLEKIKYLPLYERHNSWRLGLMTAVCEFKG